MMKQYDHLHFSAVDGLGRGETCGMIVAVRGVTSVDGSTNNAKTPQILRLPTGACGSFGETTICRAHSPLSTLQTPHAANGFGAPGSLVNR